MACTLAETADVVCVETLNVGVGAEERRRARAVSDAGLSMVWGEIAWQCEKRGVSW